MELQNNLVDDEFIASQNLENIIIYLDDKSQNFENNKETLTKNI